MNHKRDKAKQNIVEFDRCNFTLCSWNINGFSKWKQKHKEIISLMKYDISLLVETWLTNEECELIKQTHSKEVEVVFSCRNMNRNAKRNFGGLLIFIRKNIRSFVSVAQHTNEDIIWLKIDKQSTNYDFDVYLCCTYLLISQGRHAE